MIDRILYNGTIITLDDHHPRVSALAIGYGRIITTGPDDKILPLAKPHTRLENLDKKIIIPGLTDAHIHWEWLSRSLHSVDVFDVKNKQEAIQRVADFAADIPSGEWVTGRGWTQEQWEIRAFPTAADLDSASPHHPIFLAAKSGHAAWVNSFTLRLCGIDRDTPDPEGGRIARDENGDPTGILFESAMELARSKIPGPSLDQQAQQMLAAQKLALASGLTGIHDFDPPSCLQALQLNRERQQLAIRVIKNINQNWLSSALELGIRWGFGDEWIRFGGLKMFADGALGTRTAYMIEPYINEPDNYGIPVVDKEELLEFSSRASAAGIPSTIHAIGDRAVRDVLDVYEALRKEEAARGETPAQRRHRIEHVQLIHPDDVHRLKKLEIIASMQPIHATSDWEMADMYWGERSRYAYNPRIQIDQGVVVAFGSDAPVESFDPLKGIHAAVTRQHPDGSPGKEGWRGEARLTVDEALRGFTIGPAYTAGMENLIGRLMPGYLADLVVLDRDLYSIPPSEILEANVLATMVGGEWQYRGI